MFKMFLLSVLFVAHRGEYESAPEGSLAAFRVAMQRGDDIIKLDVCETKDGIPVISHDVSLSRVGGWDVKIADVTLSEIKEKCILKPSRADSQWKSERVPTLAEVIAETKDAPGFWVDFKMFNPAFAERVLEEFERADIPLSRVSVATFSVPALEYMKKQHPSVCRIGHVDFGFNHPRLPGKMHCSCCGKWVEIAGHSLWECVEAYARRLGLSGVNLPCADDVVTKDVVERFHQLGCKVAMHFVSNPKVAVKYAEMGVDMFVTGYSVEAREALNSGEHR